MRNDSHKNTVKLFWWRLNEDGPGNFGDEITRLLIKKLFNVDTVWATTKECDMIGAGSILAESYETKGENKPFVWGSGFIRDDKLRVSMNDFKFCSVRGTSTRSRIDGSGKDLPLGDPGLLASYLLPGGGTKRIHKIGILPHYKDVDTEFMRVLSNRKDIYIIDATWPCEKVIEAIASCEALISSSLHGLIVGDSVGTPNIHVSMSSMVEGGEYKFRDYYSVFRENRYRPTSMDTIYHLTNTELFDYIQHTYVVPANIADIKQSIIDAFPYK